MTMDTSAAKREYLSEMSNLTEASMERVLNFQHLNQYLRREDLISIISSTRRGDIILKAADMAISKFGRGIGNKVIDSAIIQLSKNPDLTQALLGKKEGSQ
ncbi:MAG TPA: hypothetical protein VND15_00455 [Candidatus Acidoferrales bacterium]|nr:hypothetical protein [Candidatus Acidoferrales bacterium]